MKKNPEQLLASMMIANRQFLARITAWSRTLGHPSQALNTQTPSSQSPIPMPTHLIRPPTPETIQASPKSTRPTMIQVSNTTHIPGVSSTDYPAMDSPNTAMSISNPETNPIDPPKNVEEPSITYGSAEDLDKKIKDREAKIQGQLNQGNAGVSI